MSVFTYCSEVVFACHSAVCRPPGKNGGTGGSLPEGKVDAPISKEAKASMRALKGEADSIADELSADPVYRSVSPIGKVDPKVAEMELRITAHGQRVHAALEKILTDDPEMSKMTKTYQDMMEQRDRLEKERDDSTRRIYARLDEITKQEMARTGKSAGYVQASFSDEIKAEILKMHAEHNAKWGEPGAREKGSALIDELDRRIVRLEPKFEERRASVIAQALNEVVPMGGTFDNTPKQVKSKMGYLSTNDCVSFAAKLYPQEWIGASNEKGLHLSFDRTVTWKSTDGAEHQTDHYDITPLLFRASKARQHYHDNKLTPSSVMNSIGPMRLAAEKRMRADGADVIVNSRRIDEVTVDQTDKSVTVHEIGHRMEHVLPVVTAMEAAFLHRRTGGSKDVKWLGKGHGKDEQHVPDDLFSPYAEKVYGLSQRFREVFTMGWQYYVSGKSVRGRKPDADHMGLVLGLLTTVRSSSVDKSKWGRRKP